MAPRTPTSRGRSPGRSPSDALYDRRVVLSGDGDGTPGTYVQYGPSWNNGASWSSYASPGSRPAPPRHPLIEELSSRAAREGLLNSTGERSDGRGRGRVQRFSCWRLRLAAFCLVLGTAAQATAVGGQLQGYIVPGGAIPTGLSFTAPLAVAVSVLVLLLAALWSLLSQLLLWSDSAVLRVPQGVGVQLKDEADEFV